MTEPYKSPNWTVGHATAQVGDDAKFVFGEATQAVVGFQFGFNVGGWINVCVDPSVCLPGSASEMVTQAFKSNPLLRIYSSLIGRSQFLLCNNSTIRLGCDWAMDFAGRDEYAPSPEQKETLKSFFKLMGGATVAGLIMAGALPRVLESAESRSAAANVAIFLAPVYSTVVLAIILNMMGALKSALEEASVVDEKAKNVKVMCNDIESFDKFLDDLLNEVNQEPKGPKEFI